MSAPRTIPASLHTRILPALFLLLATASGYAKGPEPPLHIALADVGVEPQGSGPLAGAASVTTVNFIDEQHLLVTFRVRRLMKRLPDDTPGDEDRTIEAAVVELPSGTVIAKTNWRVHDAGRYLWSLGHGRFLLRNHNTLTTFMPLENLHSGKPFTEEPFLKLNQPIMALILAPENDLLTIEMTSERSRNPDSHAEAPKRTDVNFYRLLQPNRPEGRMLVQAAGIAITDEPINLSITSAGYIETAKKGQNRWFFNFDSYAGKDAELALFDTSCRPQPFFVSASEFIAFGCLGGDQLLSLGGFNMHGEQMWQQNFRDTFVAPNFVFVPSAGRFAFSRNVTLNTLDGSFSSSNVTSQQISVYQTHNGKQLLQVEATPVQRFGENYDLSPQGLHLAVIHGDGLDVYSLPVLTAKDETAIRQAKAERPEDTGAIVHVRSHRKVIADDDPEPPPPPSSANKPQQVTHVSFSAAEGPAAPDNDATTLGDPEPGRPRKAPTLYTLPTDGQGAEGPQ